MLGLRSASQQSLLPKAPPRKLNRILLAVTGLIGVYTVCTRLTVADDLARATTAYIHTSDPAPPNEDHVELQALSTLFYSPPNAQCALSAADLSPVTPYCPALPVCTSRTELLSSFALGSRRAGFGEPFCFHSCRPRWLSRTQVCAVLAEYESVAFLGDSLVRQLHQALMMLVTGDMHMGSIKSWEVDDAETCACEKGFTTPACREHIIRRTPHDLSPVQLADSCLQDLQLEFHEVLHLSNLDKAGRWRWQAPDTSRPTGSRKRAVVAGTGPWDNYDPANITATAAKIAEHLVRQALDPVVGPDEPVAFNAASFRTTRPFFDFLWVMPPAAGINKPREWLETQGNPVILQLHERILPQLKEWTIPFMSRFNQTVAARSYDGTHFGYLPALEQAMVLLNWLSLPA